MPPLLFKYPALRLSILVAVGIVAGHRLDPPLSVSVLFLLVALVVAGALFALSRTRPALPLALAIHLLALLLGSAKLGFDVRRQSEPPEESRALLVVGRVIEPPTTTERQTRFVLRTSELITRESAFPYRGNVLVTLRHLRTDTASPDVQYGMLLGLRGIVSRPSQERNPGEFNARQFYEANGIRLLMSVRGAESVVVLEREGGWWLMREVILPARAYLLDLIDTTIGGEEGEFLKGIMIGERSGISFATREAFTNSGVAHVLAVSGSNVAVVAAFLFLLLGLFRIPRALRIGVTMAALVAYMLLTGSQPPVVRATIMAGVFLLGALLQTRPNALNTLGLAALIIFAIDARQLFDVGFQLSFAAVLAIVTLYPRTDAWIVRLSGDALWRRAVVWTLRVCAVSAVATLGTLPLTAMSFGRVAVVGILANIVVIPAVGLSVILGGVSALTGVFSTWLAEVYAGLNGVLLHATLRFTNWAGGLSFASVDTLRFTAVDAAPFYLFLILIFHLQMRAVVRPLLILTLVACNIAVYAPAPGAYASPGEKLRMSFIDVGQGDAVLLEFPRGRTMLIDAGPRALHYDAGERIVAPFLRRRGISAIDLLIVSHPHSDHVGGVPAVLRKFEVRKVIDNGQPVRSEMYRSYLSHVRQEECAFTGVSAGTLLTDFEGVRLYTLYPSASRLVTDTTRRHPNLNNTSVVLKVQYRGMSVLLAGDAETEAEEDLVDAYGDFLQATILKVGHHGSITSSTPGFLHAVRPSYAVISVGRENRFGHPSEEVLQRLSDLSTSVYRTDEDGAVILETDGEIIRRVEWR